MSRFNKISFFLISAIVFLSILYKLIFVPITHDEVSTVVHYYNFTVWEIMMYPDNWPNNHILNTLMAKIFINIFGKEVWAIRIPSLIGYFVYLFAIYRLLIIFFKKDSILIIAGITLFISNPYLLDFFGLSRGYAMASALVTLSVSYLITAFEHNEDKHLWLAFILSTIASYANFTVLVFWVAIGLLSILFFILKYKTELGIFLKNIGVLFIASLFYLGLIIVPLIKMTSTNQFKYWSSDGFYNDTVLSIINDWKYADRLYYKASNNSIGLFITILFAFSFIIILKKIWNKQTLNIIIRDKHTVAFVILTLTIIVNLIQTFILKTPNIKGRIALFFYPLFIIIIISYLSNLDKSKWIKYFFAVLIPLFSFYHLTNSFRPKEVSEWWYDANTLEVIDYLQNKKTEQDIVLQTHWLFHNSFYFYTSTGKANGIKLRPINGHEIIKNTDAEYYYVVDTEVQNLEPKFQKIKKFGWDRWLMKRIK